MGEFIPDRKKLIARLRAHKSAGETIVTTNGVFDVLHVGHIRYLAQAKSLGNVLVVAINTDRSTRALKGEPRPFVPEAERAEMVAALASVDYTTLFDESTPAFILDELQPDIHAKGGDYEVESMPETPIVKKHGGKVVVLSFVPDRSTTDIAERILNSRTKAETTD